jgi:hypothetical protein
MQLDLFDCTYIDGPSPGPENSKIWTPPEETESSSAFSDKSLRKYLDRDKKEAKRQENRRYRSKKKQLKRAEVETVLLPLQSHISSYRTSYVDALAEVRAFYKAQPLPEARQSSSVPQFRWNTLPPSLNMHYGDGHNNKKRIDPAEIKKIEAREQRKRHQCEAFAGAIEALNLPNGSVIVDFGSGSCGLTLPLAFFLPHLQFVAVDLKEKVNTPSR